MDKQNPIVYGKQGVETSFYLNDEICQRLIEDDIEGLRESQLFTKKRIHK